MVWTKHWSFFFLHFHIAIPYLTGQVRQLEEMGEQHIEAED